jgi:hypothetical protein
MRSRLRRLSLPLLALAALAFAAACGTADLETSLSDTYGKCLVHPMGSDLVVTFLSSPFAERAEEARERTARKVAEHVRDHYPPYKGLDKVIVEFQTPKETAAASLAPAAARYVYTRADLEPPRT